MMVQITAEIQGADKSSVVTATTNVDWIKNFNYREPGYVQFDYTALDEGVETRSGQITLERFEDQYCVGPDCQYRIYWVCVRLYV